MHYSIITLKIYNIERGSEKKSERGDRGLRVRERET